MGCRLTIDVFLPYSMYYRYCLTNVVFSIVLTTSYSFHAVEVMILKLPDMAELTVKFCLPKNLLHCINDDSQALQLGQ